MAGPKVRTKTSMSVLCGWRRSAVMAGVGILGGLGFLVFDTYQLTRPPDPEQRSLRAYSTALRNATISGARTRDYLARIPQASPVSRLIALYAILKQQWRSHAVQPVRDGRDGIN